MARALRRKKNLRALLKIKSSNPIWCTPLSTIIEHTLNNTPYTFGDILVILQNPLLYNSQGEIINSDVALRCDNVIGLAQVYKNSALTDENISINMLLGNNSNKTIKSIHIRNTYELYEYLFFRTDKRKKITKDIFDYTFSKLIDNLINLQSNYWFQSVTIKWVNK